MKKASKVGSSKKPIKKYKLAGEVSNDKGKGKKASTGQRYGTAIGVGKKKIEKAISEGNPNNPPVVQNFYMKTKQGDRLTSSKTIDTTGFAAGKKIFPVSYSSPNSKGPGTITVEGRGSVESAIKKPTVVRHKMGGSVKKSSKNKK